MKGDQHYPDKPYRLSGDLQKDSWRAYGLDDAEQERHLGRIVQEQGSTYHAVSACATYQDDFRSIDEAIEVLYERCMESGYLQKEHPNYLREVAR